MTSLLGDTMANKITIKKSSVQGKVPTAQDLDYGELAINYADGKLFYKRSDNSIQQLNAAGGGGGGSGTVTSVGISSSDLTVSGSPVTTSGSISLSLNTVSISKGGTGATTQAEALQNIVGYTPVNKAGDTMTGALTLSANPSSSLHAATKQYVDNVATGLNIHLACRTATSSSLTATYDNGTSGVGATLTGTGSLPQISGVTLTTNDRVLVKSQSTTSQNGIYVVTTTVDNWVLTRASDFDGSPTGEIVAGDAVYIQEGTLAGTHWVMSTSGTITIGSSAIVWSQFGGPGTFVAGTAISIDGTTVNNTGVTSLTGGTNIGVSASTGGITVSFSGTLPIASGGTGATTASDARTNLSVAKSGANSDITSLSGLTTALSIAQGGTGQTSFSAGYIKSNGTALISSSTISAGDITGSVGSANTVQNTGAVTTDANFYLPFIENNTTTAQALNTTANLKYNPNTGTLYAPVLSVNQGNIGTITLITTTNAANQVIDSVSGTTYRTVKYVIQVSSGSSHQTSEMLITHDDSVAYYTEFANINTGTALATFNANYTNGTIQLRVTPTNAVTTIRAIRTCINV